MYAVVINGTTFYIEADITDKQRLNIESIAKGFIQLPKDSNIILKDFIDTINQNLGIKMTQVPIESVFRVS